VVLARLDSPAMPISWTEHVLVSAGPSTCWSMGAGPGTARAYARLQLFGRPSASLMSCRRIRTTASHCRRNRPLRPTGRSDGLHPGRQRQGEHGQLDQGDHRHSCMPPTPRTCSPSSASPPHRRRPDGKLSRAQRRRRQPAAGGVRSLPRRRIGAPTQGSANPALTIMALASRLAQRMAGGAAMNDDPAVRAGRTRSVAGSRR
jgi:hypothetical protein